MQVESFSEITTIHDQDLLNLICSGLEESGIPFLIEPVCGQDQHLTDRYKLFSPRQNEHQIIRIIELAKRDFEQTAVSEQQQLSEYS